MYRSVKSVAFSAGVVVVLTSNIFMLVYPKLRDSFKVAKPYVEMNLKGIMEAQEKRLGIKHSGAPAIEYSYPPSSSIETRSHTGIYDPDSNTLYLPSTCSEIPGREWETVLMRLLTLGAFPCTNIKEVLDHELGHFYEDRLLENAGLDYMQIVQTNLGARTIAEGIAEYFKMSMNRKEGDATSYYDLDVSENIYYRGYGIVKPIIDLYGVRGIAYLVLDLPSDEELKPAKAYIAKVLENLQ